MAYGTKYIIPFKNRDDIICEVQILLDGFVGDSTTLEGGENPFRVSWHGKDGGIPYGIKASEATIEFISGGLSLIDFYTEDANAWKIVFYYDSTIIWTGYLQLDDCSEELQDIDHVITLTANDGLGKLQNLYLLEDQADPNTLIYEQWKLTELFAFIFAFIGTELNTAAYLNIFENTTNDRSDDEAADCLQQTVINTNYYTQTGGTTLNLYEILNTILTDFRSVLFQSDGIWNIIRWADLRLYSDGTMLGTLYDSEFNVMDSVVFPAKVAIGRGLTVHPVNENQLSKILRPLKYAKETFNYEQPPFIIQADLQLPIGATPYDTNTIDDIRYDDYDTDTYFPFWKRVADDSSFLRVATDTLTDTEVDRYIVNPIPAPTRSGLQVNPIPVSAGDLFDLKFLWRTDNDTDDLLRFYIRITIITPDDKFYGLFANYGISPSWSGPFAITGTYPIDGVGEIYMEFANPDDIDTTEWVEFTLSQFLTDGRILPPIKQDGMMLIEIQGTNGDMDTNDQGTYWKDIRLEFTQYINSSKNVTGQYHNDSQTPDIKNNLELTPRHDDSPRNSITGTLFTDAITSFLADIGDVYFTKTTKWHREEVSEEKRLGQLNTNADLFNQKQVRTVVEGDFSGIDAVSILNVAEFSFFPGKIFVFGNAEINYMTGILNGNFYELFTEGEEDEDLTDTYLFSYIYKNN